MWKQAFQFRTKEADQFLGIQCFDEDVVSDSFIGSTKARHVPRPLPAWVEGWMRVSSSTGTLPTWVDSSHSARVLPA